LGISDNVKKKCVEMFKEGKSADTIYSDYFKPLDISVANFGTFDRQLRLWRKKTFTDDVLLEAGNLGYGYTPTRTTVQVDKNGQVVQAWIKSHANDEDLIMRLVDSIKENTVHEHIEIIPSEDTEGMLEFELCDMHFGIADLEHYKPTLQRIYKLLYKQRYDEINIVIGQDLLHNDNFNGTTTKGTFIEKVDMVKAWNDAKTFWYNVIDKAIEQTNKIKIIYSKGNHDKTISWAFMQMLKERYGEKVIDDSLSARKGILYKECFIGVTHGEFKKNKPSDLRSQFSIKFPMEFATCKTIEVHCGHLHRESELDEYGVMCRRVSTGNKEDEWSDEEGHIGAIKRFMIFEWSEDRLTDIHYV
jgi:hypothetical protein